ncbi:MAG: extracellular solute-binding protein [Thermaerobacter sp.]|nr:extracellular solute-binding protein [Thermaerobacter sp.]
MRSRAFPRRAFSSAAALALMLGLAGCGANTSGKPSAAIPAGNVNVLYAGSLVDVMENGIGPAFHKATGYTLQGIAAGSKALVNQIKGRLRQGDVFISASPSVNALLMGKANGNYVSWYATFAQAPLVIGYDPTSRFAHDLRTKPWYLVLQEPGFRLGRTDPILDPKGALTVQAVQAAQTYYRAPGLAQHILGGTENPAQVFPEEDLLGRLQSGQLDAGFFYSNEAAQAHIPVIHLPAALQFDATFTVTVLRGAPHAAAAQAFIRFLLGKEGQAILRGDGLQILPPHLHGNAASVPTNLRRILGN